MIKFEKTCVSKINRSIMVSEGEIHYFYEQADLREPIFVYPYKDVGYYDSVKDDEKEIELKILDPNIKLEILPLILAYADEPQSMTCFTNYDENGDRDLISVATTRNSDENEILFNLFENLSSINEAFKSFFEKLKANKKEIDFYYFEFPKKLKVQ